VEQGVRPRAAGGVALAGASAALVAFFTQDVLVNLWFGRLVLVGDVVPARPRDFLGLATAEAAVAVLAGGGAALLARITRRIPAGGSFQNEALALVTAAAAAGPAVARGVEGWGLEHVGGVRLVAAAGMAALAWLGVRLLLRGVGRPSIGLWLGLPTLVGLGAGAAGHGMMELVRGGRAAGAAQLLGALALLALAVQAGRGRRRPWATLLSWSPPALALGVAVLACVRFADFGRPVLPAPADPSGARPNIVLIVLDTLRADHLRRYGYARDTMPALERWADRALTVGRAVAPGGWTAPSHASLFSGLPVSLHGIHFAETKGELRTRARSGVRWLPEQLAGLGYRSIAVSANHWAVPEEVGGFDRRLVPERSMWNGPSIARALEEALPVPPPFQTGWRKTYVDAEGIVDIVLRSVPAAPGSLFLFVNLVDPHDPYDPPAHVQAALDIRVPLAARRYHWQHRLRFENPDLTAEEQQAIVDLYDGELRGMDEQLERLLRWIDVHLGEDATVIITSDHGEELGEEGVYGHRWGLRQRVVHVPLFIRSPSLSPGELEGVVSIRRVHDVILRLARGEPLDADVLAEVDEFGVLSERYRLEDNSEVFGASNRSFVAFFEGNLKGVGPSQEGFELSDVGAKGFSREAPADEPAAARRLRDRIDVYWRDHGDRRDEGASVPVSEEERKRLRALGYVR
jgi:hypothetical protein